MSQNDLVDLVTTVVMLTSLFQPHFMFCFGSTFLLLLLLSTFFFLFFIFIRLMHLLSLSTQLMCVIVSLGKSKDKKRSQQPKLRKGSEAEEIKIK